MRPTSCSRVAVNAWHTPIYVNINMKLHQLQEAKYDSSHFVNVVRDLYKKAQQRVLKDFEYRRVAGIEFPNEQYYIAEEQLDKQFGSSIYATSNTLKWEVAQADPQFVITLYYHANDRDGSSALEVEVRKLVLNIREAKYASLASFKSCNFTT